MIGETLLNIWLSGPIPDSDTADLNETARLKWPPENYKLVGILRALPSGKLPISK